MIYKNFTSRMITTFLLIATASLVGCASLNFGSSSWAQCREVVKSRLLIMPDVARFKYETDTPVEDLEREKQIISEFVAKANDKGIEKNLAKQIIIAQISASKSLQNKLIQKWKAAPPESKFIGDLKSTIRPQIDIANAEFLEILVILQKNGYECSSIKKFLSQPSELGNFPEAWSIATQWSQAVCANQP